MTLTEGLRLLREGKYLDASEVLNAVIEINDQDPKAWNALGIVCFKVGRKEDAATCFENALMIEPGNITYQKNFDKIQNFSTTPAEIRPITKISTTKNTDSKSSNWSLSSNFYNKN